MTRESGAGLKHPHDLVVRSILADADVTADFLRNYLDPDLASLLDLEHMTRESPIAVDEDLVETMGDLRYMTRFKGTGRLSRVFAFADLPDRSCRHSSGAVERQSRGARLAGQPAIGVVRDPWRAVQGKVEGRAEIIIDILTVRFGKIPATLEKKIRAVRDAARVSELGKCIVTCKTLNDFKKLL